MSGPADKASEPKEHLKSNPRSFLLKALVLFVVITGGVAAGFLLSVWLIGNNSGGGFDVSASSLLNRTRLGIGDEFPGLSLIDEDGHLVHLAALLRDRRTILTFVAEGCEPCDDLLIFLGELDTARAGIDQFVFLALDIENLSHAADFDYYQVDRRTLTGLGIDMFPTVVGIEKNGEIAFVSSGFSRIMAGKVIEEQF